METIRVDVGNRPMRIMALYWAAICLSSLIPGAFKTTFDAESFVQSLLFIPCMNPTGKILAVGDPRADTQLRNVLLHGILLGLLRGRPFSSI
jgi:hypothetical protein